MRCAVTGLLAAVVACLPAVCSADTVIVDFDGVASTYTKIQQGIDAAADGDEVLVMAFFSFSAVFSGPGNRDLDFGGKNIALRALSGSQNTTIECEGAARAFVLDASVDSTSVIEGFTIQNGYADDAGGAIWCAGGCPRLVDCVFRGNNAAYGGAVKTSSGATRFSACTFYGNDALQQGGAVYASGTSLRLSGCTFSDNEAVDGGAVAIAGGELTAKRCTFANNNGDPGAGVLLSGTGVIEQCVLAFNRDGRGLWGGTPETFHSCIYGNEDGDDLPGTEYENIFLDPLFCNLYGVSGGNLSLCSNSSCLQPNNIWNLPIGSKAQGCADCDSPVTPSSWGGVKALYRQ